MGTIMGKWQGQLKAAEASGLSLSAYAAQRGINVRRLYEARHALARATKSRQTSAFVPVKLKPQALVTVTPEAQHGQAAATRFAMQARLDNGVVLDWTYDAERAAAQANLLHTLAALPCFA